MSESEIKAPGPRAGVIGDIAVSDLVIVKLAGYAAQTTYGVIAMHRSPLAGIARLFRGPFTEGVDVDLRDGEAEIGLHVVMERGINLAQVTANLQEQVRYQVEQFTGVKVKQVSVRVEDVRE